MPSGDGWAWEEGKGGRGEEKGRDTGEENRVGEGKGNGKRSDKERERWSKKKEKEETLTYELSLHPDMCPGCAPHKPGITIGFPSFTGREASQLVPTNTQSRFKM